MLTRLVLLGLCACALSTQSAVVLAATDTTPPTVLSVSPPPGVVTSLTQVTVTFSEPVTGVNADDLYINFEPASSITGGGATYTFSFIQPPYGNASFTWFADHG